MALAITPPGVLEPFRSLKRLQPRFETALWLEPYRAADEYSQLWKRHTSIISYLGTGLNPFEDNIKAKKY